MNDIKTVPADIVNGADKGGKIDCDVVLDRYTGYLGDSFHCKAWTAPGQLGALPIGVRGVDAAVSKTRDVHVKIPGDGKHARCFANRIDRRQNNCVCTKGAIGTADRTPSCSQTEKKYIDAAAPTRWGCF